ncbi:MAG: hydrogenase maturation nickel metallochaperone HypA [Gammaproteobacteria bacterium]|nr:hydrogenase maturation nickel metallochaperone HypA [Gammaproteobacteria bacterium]MBU0787323.1 hydrogenase maturation nickel metallochaperone HypA [Gammaproteobacteria bacterium]MBU0816063.1 hydrogenase maturation nickel metallochaperone HypA [Gammaproteobacteria bacterium]MBU1787602.1 hydrogenase maturation nickel metallochaperone HypA [Gammaproteobacteria bacterium]
MHELSLATDILRMVEQAAARERFLRVGQLHLEAGALAGVEVEALRFALDAIAPGTCLQGAQITIDEPAGRAWCARCNAEVTINTRADPCPQCSGYPVTPTGGDTLRVLDLLVLDEERSTPCV